MKKLVLLALASILLSCSNNDNANSSNNGNSFTNSMDYEFTIKINGEVHKVKGNTTNGIPYGNAYSIVNQINNTCYAMNIGGSLMFASLGINDVTATNYISGQNLTCQIQLPNLLLGTNQATVNFSGGYFQTLATSLGSFFPSFLSFQTTSGISNSATTNYLPINITDLGTSSTNSLGNGGSNYNQYNFGQTLKGNYSGTIYLRNTTNLQYTIPVQLSIDFKVLRRY